MKRLNRGYSARVKNAPAIALDNQLDGSVDAPGRLIIVCWWNRLSGRSNHTTGWLRARFRRLTLSTLLLWRSAGLHYVV